MEKCCYDDLYQGIFHLPLTIDHTNWKTRWAHCWEECLRPLTGQSRRQASKQAARRAGHAPGKTSCDSYLENKQGEKLGDKVTQRFPQKLSRQRPGSNTSKNNYSFQLPGKYRRPVSGKCLDVCQDLCDNANGIGQHHHDVKGGQRFCHARGVDEKNWSAGEEEHSKATTPAVYKLHRNFRSES